MTLSEQQSVSRIEDSLDPEITLPRRRAMRAEQKVRKVRMVKRFKPYKPGQPKGRKT
jgi:hypothetical protein